MFGYLLLVGARVPGVMETSAGGGSWKNYGSERGSWLNLGRIWDGEADGIVDSTP